MKKFIKTIIFVLIAATFLVTVILGRANYENTQMLPDSLFTQDSKGDNIELIFPTNRLPDTHGFQYTDEIATMYNCFGTFGSKVDGPYGSDYHYPSFMTPRDGNQEYLYVGSIWIGGIIGDDTLVSIGNDGWMTLYSEFWPPHEYTYKSVTETKSPADFAMHAEFYDTLYENNSIFWPTWPYHYPLNIGVALRSQAWFDAPNSQTIIYDMVITNIGEDVINEGRVGLFFDSDVYDYNYGYTYNRHKDDISGSIQEKGIAYTIDNDGDPIEDQFDEKSSPTRIFAVKFIESSFEPQDTIFNWWITSADSKIDFGPRQKGTEENPFREFYGNYLGQPEYDNDKYYLLSHSEWDYDQISTPTIGPDDPIWLEPNPENTPDITDGGDTRFLLSIGPVDIYPDSSIRILFATFTGEDVHTDVNNLDNLPANPEAYLSNLDFTNVLRNADISDSLGQLLLNPLNPVNGLKVEYHDKDSVIIRWDPFVFDGVEGYEVYLSAVPFDDLPHPGTIPPWLEPEEMIHHTSLDEINKYTLTDININKAYFVNVASRSNGIVGESSKSIIIDRAERSPAPQQKSDFLFQLSGNKVTINWHVKNSAKIDHFNIYKFDSLKAAENAFHAYYQRRADPLNGFLNDSIYVNEKWYYYFTMSAYNKINSQAREFNDHDVEDGTAYIISAVDRLGFESEFSDPIVFHTHSPPDRDILLLTTVGMDMIVESDTILNFYHEILSGYDYEILHYTNPAEFPDCEGQIYLECLNWNHFESFKILIVDGGLDVDLLGLPTEDDQKIFTRYLLSGGTIVFFDSFTRNFRFVEPSWNVIKSPFAERFLDIDSVFNMSLGYYFSVSSKPYIDSLAGFIKAKSVLLEAPDVDFDDTRYPFVAFLKDYWPIETGPGVAAFVVNSEEQTTHTFYSKYPETSRAEGYPVGVKTVTDEATTYLYGFHLWYMEPDDARELINFIAGKTPTDIDNNDRSTIPKRFELNQNIPNPFNASTNIKYSLPLKSDVIISIYNILGQKINLLVNEEKPAGNYSVIWDGTDLNGRPTASGIYLYQIKAGDFVETKKMLLLK